MVQEPHNGPQESDTVTIAFSDGQRVILDLLIIYSKLTQLSSQ